MVGRGYASHHFGRRRILRLADFGASVGSALLAKPMNGINAPQRPDCVADDAVSCELVSAPNSLLTGKLTGNFAESGPLLRFRRPINELIQRLAAKFPTQWNREFLQP